MGDDCHDAQEDPLSPTQKAVLEAYGPANRKWHDADTLEGMGIRCAWCTKWNNGAPTVHGTQPHFTDSLCKKCDEQMAAEEGT